MVSGIMGNNNIIIKENDRIKIIQVKDLYHISDENLYCLSYSLDTKMSIWSKIDNITKINNIDCCKIALKNGQNCFVSKKNMCYQGIHTKSFFLENENSYSQILSVCNKFNFDNEGDYLESALLGTVFSEFSKSSENEICWKIYLKDMADYIIDLLNKLNINYKLSQESDIYNISIKKRYNLKDLYSLDINYLGFLDGYFNTSGFCHPHNKKSGIFTIQANKFLVNMLTICLMNEGVKFKILPYNRYGKLYYHFDCIGKSANNILNKINLRDGIKQLLENINIEKDNVSSIYKTTINSVEYLGKNTVYDIEIDSENVFIGQNGFVLVTDGDEDE